MLRIRVVTLEKALSRYLKSVSVLKKGFEAESYRINVLQKDPIACQVMKDITSVDIATYRDRRLSTPNARTGKPVSNATVRLELSLLSNVFDVGRIEWGYCGDNPVKNVRKPKPAPGRERRLTARESKQILRYAADHSNPELYSIIVIALETAMRQGEILNLTWERINFKTSVAHLEETKNGSKRDVPLSIKARDALVRLGMKSKGQIFSYKPAGIKSTWRFLTQKLRIDDLHFHDLRHEAISRLFELGTLDLMEVAAISGHKSLSMLKRYTHLRAHKLVQKLEGNRSKGKHHVLSHMIPYPASLVSSQGGYKVSLLDFDDMEFISDSPDSAIENARNGLLRRIMASIKDSIPIPEPDQYIHYVDESRIIMVDPLALI